MTLRHIFGLSLASRTLTIYRLSLRQVREGLRTFGFAAIPMNALIPAHSGITSRLRLTVRHRKCLFRKRVFLVNCTCVRIEIM